MTFPLRLKSKGAADVSSSHLNKHGETCVWLATIFARQNTTEWCIMHGASVEEGKYLLSSGAGALPPGWQGCQISGLARVLWDKRVSRLIPRNATMTSA